MLQPTHSTTKKQFNGRNMNNETTIQKKEITSSYKQHLQFETNTNNNITSCLYLSSCDIFYNKQKANQTFFFCKQTNANFVRLNKLRKYENM